MVANLRLPCLLVLLAMTALALSCRDSSSTKQAQPFAGVSGQPLPLTQDSAVPAVPDPIEVYVVNADGGDPKLLTVVPHDLQFAWSPDDDHAALVTDMTDRSAKLHIISVKDGTDQSGPGIGDFPYGAGVWSPDGEWLVWTEGSPYGGGLKAMHGDGSGYQELAGQATIVGWTANDKLLVTEQEESDSNLIEFNLSNGRERDVAKLPQWPQSIDLSKDGSQMAFLSGAGDIGCDQAPAFNVSIVNVKSGKLRQLLPGTCGLQTVRWSPDGKELAYSVTTRDDARGTYLLDVGSRETRKLSDSSDQFDYIEGWTLHGSHVVVDRSACPGYDFCMAQWPQIVLIPVTGGDEHVISSTVPYLLSSDRSALAFDQDGLQLASLPDGNTHQVMAADSDWQFNLLGWSPDGQWFAFARSHNSQIMRQYEVNADGADLERLDNLAEWPDLPPTDEGDVPSPDGSKTAVLGDPLRIKDSVTSNEVSIDDIHGGQASWSPDGQTLVFANCSSSSEASALYLVNPDGSGLKQLTDGSSRDCNPVFSPDGKILAFVRMKLTEEQVVTLDLAALTENVVFDFYLGAGASDYWPAWSPDGTRIALFIWGAGIYVVNSDGSGNAEVVVDSDWFGGQYIALRWQSNDRLYFVSSQ